MGCPNKLGAIMGWADLTNPTRSRHNISSWVQPAGLIRLEKVEPDHIGSGSRLRKFKTRRTRPEVHVESFFSLSLTRMVTVNTFSYVNHSSTFITFFFPFHFSTVNTQPLSCFPISFFLLILPCQCFIFH